jgi:hypothetical protein
MSWWPFGKQRAAEAEREFHEMLDEAMLRKGDLEEATERLKESRKKRKAVASPEPSVEVPQRSPRIRNA